MLKCTQMSFVELKNVRYAYNRGSASEVVAIKDLSFCVEKGEFVALVGHNGSGKSTVAKLLNGLLLPQSGTVTVDGMNTVSDNVGGSASDNIFEIRKKVGVVFQNPDNQTVASIIEDDVAFGPENLGLEPKEIRRRVDEALKSVGMYEYRERDPFRLSGGQKQRVAIAGILAIRPEVLVLDEATSMLDPKGKREIMDIVTRLNREEGMTVITITHFMDEAAMADKIIVLDDGEAILCGGKEVLTKGELLSGRELDMPPAIRIADRLRKGGMPIGDVYTVRELTEELCRLL